MSAVLSFPIAGAGLAAGSRRMTDDEDLIARASRGEPAAFRTLYARHRADVARLIYRMLNGSADVDDVVQEVFVQVYKSLKDFRGQAKLSTWIHRVTVNVVLMHRRAARSRPTYSEELPPETTPDDRHVGPDEDADRRARVRAFSALVERLADKKRVVFILHDLEGVPPHEIAEIVGAPVLTVRTRLFYARRELETLIAGEPLLSHVRGTFSKAAGGES